MKQSYFIYQYKKVLLIIFAIIINGQSKQPNEMEVDISTIFFSYTSEQLDTYLIPWQFSYKYISIYFNIIKNKALLIRSTPNNLCHNQKWPIKAAKQNRVTYLKMTNCNSHYQLSKVKLNLRNYHTSSYKFLFIFQKY